MLNYTSGVSIEIEGVLSAIKEFVNGARTQPHPQILIFEIQSHHIEPDQDFEIKKSVDQEDRFVRISPEFATCEDWRSELFNSYDRWYQYPFINSTNFGPRFTLVKDIPYDRKC